MAERITLGRELEVLLTNMRRAVASARLAPRRFLAELTARPQIGARDRGDISELARLLGPAQNKGSRNLVLLSYQPSPYALKIEALIGRAMQARGWRVHVIANADTMSLARAYHGQLLGAEVLRLEDYVRFPAAAALDEALSLAARDLAAFKRWHYRGAPLGLHALATLSASRPDGIVAHDRQALHRLGRLLRYSVLFLDAAHAAYQELRPQLALAVEKGFVGTCETYHAALESRVDFVQWVSCHEPEAIMLKRYGRRNEREHPFSIGDRNWTRLTAEPWCDGYYDTVMGEFERGYRAGAWFRYKGLDRARQFPERAALQARLGLDPSKKTAVIYSHILNDANLFYGADLFAGGYEEWLVETVRAAGDNPSVNWVLKLHPANAVRNARLGYGGEYGELIALRQAFGRIPEYLRIVSPDDDVSPLAFFGLTDWGVTVRGTIGLELPCFGVAVLTAGSGRYSGKGFTVDSATAEEYLRKIRTVNSIPPLSAEQRRLGVLYAYHVFKSRPARYGAIIRDTYPMPSSHPRHRDIELRVSSREELLSHVQMEAIVRFLEASDEEDFLESRDA
jgi:hypothetical protein